MFGFEWTFRAGDILTFVGGVGVVVAFLYKRGGLEMSMKLTIDALTKEIAEMKAEFKAFSTELKKVAVQEVQISMLLKWYDELRRGKGIIHEE